MHPALPQLSGTSSLDDTVSRLRSGTSRQTSDPSGALATIAACAAGVAGLIVSNTTVARPDTLRSPHRGEAGGLSGAPLRERSTAMLRRAHRLAAGRLVLVGAGGVSTAGHAYEKIRAGAALVQLYTGFAYAGPAIVPQLLSGLAALLRRDGFSRIADAVGVEA